MFTSRKEILILCALWLLIFSSSSQFLIIAPILTELGDQLNINKSAGGTLITVYAVFLGIFALVIGPASDRVGRRKILLLGSGLMTIALLLHPLAFNYASLLIIRAITGIAGGILTGSCVAYISDYFPAHKRGKANGVIVTGSATGQIVGIPIGTLMAGSMAFYMPFLLFSLTMLIAFLLVYYFVPQPDVERIKVKLNLKETFNEYKNMLLEPKMFYTAMAYFLMFFSLTTYIVYFPTWLESSFCATKNDIAAIFFFGGLATVVAGPFSGSLSDRFGRKSIILSASAGLILLMLATSFSALQCSLNIFLLFFLIMFMISSRMVPFQALASEMVDCSRRGKFMCLTIAIGQIGMGSGAAFSGIIYTTGGFEMNSIVAILAVIAMALIVWRLLPETRNQKDISVQAA